MNKLKNREGSRIKTVAEPETKPGAREVEGGVVCQIVSKLNKKEHLPEHMEIFGFGFPSFVLGYLSFWAEKAQN